MAYSSIIYISQSVLPSLTANSIHVANICSAFSNCVPQVKLFFASPHLGTKSVKNSSLDDIKQFYDVDGSFLLFPTLWPSIKGAAVVYAILVFFRSWRHKKQSRSLVYARCLYSAALHCLLCRTDLVYESHAPARTRVHRHLEKFVFSSKRCVRVVVITNSLRAYYHSILGDPVVKNKFIVAADGATLSDQDKIHDNNSNCPKKFNIIYTGSLLPGKGADLVAELAKQMPDITFTIVGGQECELGKFRRYGLPNLVLHGQLIPSAVRRHQLAADILLLPNQKEVLCDGGRVDIGKWTSPLKLFEYMSTGKPIIASDLDVIKEVLTHRENCLLASPSEVADWVDCIRALLSDQELARRLGDCALSDIQEKYTWNKRAEYLLNQLNNKQVVDSHG